MLLLKMLLYMGTCCSGAGCCCCRRCCCQWTFLEAVVTVVDVAVVAENVVDAPAAVDVVVVNEHMI
jgi:hypothetical protein